MKIGIITYHFPYNCGAVLQCAALQTVLEKQGHEVMVINYRPWYHQNRYTPLKNPIQFARTRYNESADCPEWKRLGKACKGFFRAVLSWKHYSKRKPQDDKFKSFRTRFLNETHTYRTLEQLKKNPPKCDIYISGSDQVWNSHITGEKFDEAYFLKFGAETTARVTYAVGADFKGQKNIEEQLKILLSDLDAIALREVKCKQIIEECANNIPITCTIDPTLLMDKDSYKGLTCNNPLETEPFILTYTMPNATQRKVFNAAKLLSEQTGMKVIDVSGNPMKANCAIKDHRLCGPDEFLWYVENAQYVFTNSFHGTVFSVIFNKQFFTIPHTETGNRVTELLDMLGLSKRYTDTGINAFNRIMNPIDYSAVREQLGKVRSESLHYLENCCKIKK